MPNLSYYKMLSALDKHRTATPIDHLDNSITRAKLEYPLKDVSFAYLSVIDKVVYSSLLTAGYVVLTRDIFSDKAVFSACQVNSHCALVARLQNFSSFYVNYFNPAASSADHHIDKYENGTATRLATEAINIDNKGRGLSLSCSSSTLKSMRFEITSIIDPFNLPAPDYTLTATDTTFEAGHFGYRPLRENSPHGGSSPDAVYLKDPMSPAPEPISYLEVPVVGSGTIDDPFRAQMPEIIEIEPSIDRRIFKKYEILKNKGFTEEEIMELFPEVLTIRVNRLALTHSSLIKSDGAGKPQEYTSIVRVFHQPDRPAYLYPVEKVIEALQAIPGVRRLTREEAIRRAKQLDDKLHDYDLLQLRPDKRMVREYKEWRIHNMGVREELINEEQIAHYIGEDKGW